MEVNFFDHSVSIIGINKNNNNNYLMICAWTMMCGINKLLSLIGSQSETGKNIKIGDIVGISVLNINQAALAYNIGNTHSSECDKLFNIDYINDDGALLIKNSKFLIKAKVIDIMHLKGIENDNLIYYEVISFHENKGLFLHQGDMNA